MKHNNVLNLFGPCMMQGLFLCIYEVKVSVRRQKG